VKFVLKEVGGDGGPCWNMGGVNDERCGLERGLDGIALEVRGNAAELGGNGIPENPTETGIWKKNLMHAQ